MAHLFPFLVLIIVVISKVLTSRQSGAGPTGPTPRSAPPPTESEQERLRRFMEAVGLPADSNPPPPVRPRVAANPPPLLPVRPPAGFPRPPGRLRRASNSPARPAQSQPAARNLPPAQAPIATPIPAATAPFPPAPEIVDAPMAVVTRSGGNVVTPDISFPADALLARLRNAASLREAMILREVLGPPRALSGSQGQW